MTIPIEKIGFDFDGVIADAAEAFLRIACKKYGYCSFGVEDITNFELEDCIDIPLALVEKIFNEILMDSVGTGLQPITGATETLELFAKQSKVTIITARPITGPVYDWLGLYIPLPQLKNIKVIATGDHNDKVAHIHEHGIRYFIDDRAETCQQLAKENITPLVYSQPWNRNRHNLQTVDNWTEIRALVELTKVTEHAMP